MKAYALFTRAMALGNSPDLTEGLAVWGAFCDAAEAEIVAPTELTDPAGLAAMAAGGRLRCADYYELLGDHGAAKEQRDAASTLITAHGEGAAQIDVRRTLANSMKYEARYGEALAELTAIEAQLALGDDQIAHSRVVMDQAMLFEWLGDFDRAEELLAQVAKTHASDFESVPPMQGMLRTVLDAFGDPEETERNVALQVLRKELREARFHLARRAGHLNEAWTHLESWRQDAAALNIEVVVDYHRMVLQSERGHFQAALHHFHDIDAQMRAHPLLRSKLPALHRAAAAAALSRNPQWSLDLLQACVAPLDRTADYEVLWKVHRTTAQALVLLGRNEEASESWVAASRTVDKLRRMPLGYRLESLYFADRRPMFSEAIAHCADHGHAQQALELTELAKSRSLATLVYGGRLTEPGAVTGSPDVQRIDDLSRQIEAWDLRRFNNESPDRAERERLVAERAGLIEQVRAGDPRWRALTEPAPISTEAIIDSLDGAVAISLFLDDKTIVALSVSKQTGVHLDRIQLSSATYRELTDYCANVRRGEDPYAYDLSGFGMVGLRDLLPATTCEQLLGHDRAVFSPHDLLHLVPWGSLEIDGKRLFENSGVTTMPNLTCLAAIDGPWPAPPSVWLSGAPDYSVAASGLIPIDADGREFAGLRTVWADSLGGTTSGADSTEASLLSVLNGQGARVDLLHASCHGVVDHTEPSGSALILSDGQVDAAEIALAGASPAECVLAACSTGWRPAFVGDVDLSGDDAVGLPAAFLEAGARSVVMSIPKAHDQTSVEFMLRYHQSRAAAMAPVDAFRATQIAMLDVEDPAFWCGYVMYGSPSRQTE